MKTPYNPNPAIEFNVTQTGLDMCHLTNAINHATGLKYGYYVQQMVDTNIKSVILTLCGKPRRISTHMQEIVNAVILGWAYGRGLEITIKQEEFTS